jgi:hypothetical protein
MYGCDNPRHAASHFGGNTFFAASVMVQAPQRRAFVEKLGKNDAPIKTTYDR